ncbi:MAG: sugar phosphate nucleotidyltransferase, partial [Candidatus Saganbacteria bacterium]|nr:sugar phosphate nucleotidyltransferase [Candidatus Saganbacteria bacterium]
MQAVILAGGKGTRLIPYTAILPKPLVPVGDFPILEVIIRQLKYYGISE